MLRESKCGTYSAWSKDLNLNSLKTVSINKNQTH